MDAVRFDAWVRSLIPRQSRRAALRAAGGVVGSVLAGSSSASAATCRRDGSHCRDSEQCCGRLKCAGQLCCPSSRVFVEKCPPRRVCGDRRCCAEPEDVESFCCPTQQVCGKACCQPDWACVGGLCHCTTDESCGSGRFCVEGVCCADPNDPFSCDAGGGGYYKIRRPSP